ncbi:hypothetical protein IIC65_05825, partial [Candidatus Sumerlaeota bacterium]|nr:hypothetical protein [Candidatus Sumerlaeota bacterium]
MSALGAFGVAYLCGTLICFKQSLGDRIEAGLIRLAVGLAAAPVLVLLTGQVHDLLFSFPWFLAALGGVSALAFHLFGARSGDSSEATPSRSAALSSEEDTAPARIVSASGWALVGIYLVILLGPALSPPLNYDTLEYHLGVIPHYFQEGIVAPIPHVFYSAQPLGTEMLYTLAAALEGTAWGLGSGLIQWLLILTATALLSRLLGAVGTPKVALPWLLLLFLSHPIIVKLELDRLTDLTGCVFLLAGWLLWVRWNRWHPGIIAPRRIFLLMGLMAGGAIASKWTNAGTAALLIFIVPACAMAVRLFPKGSSPELRRGEAEREQAEKSQDSAGAVSPRPISSCAISLGCFALGAALILLPWSVWLWARVGNPFAPFAAGIFPTEQWGAERLDFLLATHFPLSPLHADYWANLYRRLASLETGPPLLTLSALALLLLVLIERRTPGGDPEKADAEVSAGPKSQWPLLGSAIVGIVLACLLWGRLQNAPDRFLAPIIAAEFVIFGISLGMLGRRLPPKSRAAMPAILVVLLVVLLTLSPMLRPGAARDFLAYWT